jgi:hypothetical protein
MTDDAGLNARLDDGAVRQRLVRLDELLDRVEQIPGPTSDAALEAIHTLTEVYGEALGRVMALAPPDLAARLVEDELVGHLLLLHGLDPRPVEERVTRALAEAQPHLGTDGHAELTSIEAGVATVRVTATGCSAAGVAALVTDAVLAAAPELTGVNPEIATSAPATPLIPAESLLRRPGAAP